MKETEVNIGSKALVKSDPTLRDKNQQHQKPASYDQEAELPELACSARMLEFKAQGGEQASHSTV